MKNNLSQYFTWFFCYFFLLLFLVNIIFVSLSFAQMRSIDSLYFALAKYETNQKEIDTNYVNALNILSNVLHQNQPDTAFYYAQRAFDASEKINFLKGKANATKQQSISLVSKKNLDKALEYWQKSIIAYGQVNDTKEIAHCLDNVGTIYEQQENFPQATEYYLKSLRNYDVIKDQKNSVFVVNKLSKVYFKKVNFDKSEIYAQKALRMAQELNIFSEIVTASHTLYEIAKTEKDYLKAIEYNELAITYRDSMFFSEKKHLVKQVDASKKEYYRQLRKMQEMLKKNEELENINLERQKLFRLALEQQSSQDKKLASELAKKEKEIQNLNKNQKILKKDKELQRIETERQKNARTALEKQSESERLLASAQNETNKQKQDSLHQLAKSKQVEVEMHLNEERRLQAESKQRTLEVITEKEAKEFQQYINYLTLAGLLGVIIFAYYIFKSRQKEIKQKEEILEQKEEIQQINEELNTTLQAVELERAKSDALLLNILPIETAQELKNTGTAIPKHYDLVTVLFTDFKGFTNIAEKFTPTQVIEELNHCFLAFDEICDKYNLEKIKTIGDAYMCAGGLPTPNSTNPYDVVCAGLEMQEWMARWKKEKEAKNEAVWELRLGIHTGEVIAGVIGKKKFAYDIWGDTVNLASRMESSGEVGKVNVSGTTYKYIKDSFSCTFRGKVKAKNKGEVDMYFVEHEL